ncbi:MAG: glycoside hydrolase family 9 protein [Fibrobacteraceae bacterium]|nr:glycoside hydrolase family 9 protein [Fibrobacteraceae bacterium]
MRKNIALTCALFAFGLAQGAEIFYNHVGYDSQFPKTIIVKSDADLSGADFQILQGGNPVFTGKLSKGQNPDNWAQQKFFVADFSDLDASGDFTFKVTENGNPVTTEAFKVVENNLATNVLPSVLQYFKDDRATKSNIWEADGKVKLYESQTTVNVQGGWYDASGDASKYLSHLSYANYLNPQQIPLTTWGLAFTAEKLSTNSTLQTPLKEEAVWGADFLLRMLSPEGYFYMTVFDGWGRIGEPREICAFSTEDGKKSTDYQAAFREGGGMAIAALALASTLNVKGDSSNAQYLEGAKRGFAHLQTKQGIGKTCAYCDNQKENIIDDYTALMATTELYRATKDETYIAEARKRAQHLIGRLDTAKGFFFSDDEKTRPFWHASDAGLPLVALVRYLEAEPTAEENKKVIEGVKKHLDWMISVTNEVENPFGYARQTYKTEGNIKNGFFIPHDNESGYWWQGENARLGSLSAAAFYASHALDYADSAKAYSYAVNQMDWITGKNPYNVCFMYGFGKNNPEKYDGQALSLTLKGGIANGITGLQNNGSGIVWNDVAAIGKAEEPWNNWRWIEQWLPHSTWYMLALAARYDDVREKPAQEIIPVEPPKDSGNGDNGGNGDAIKTIAYAQSNIQLQGHTLVVSIAGVSSQSLSIIDLKGNIIYNRKAKLGTTKVTLNHVPNGVYLVKVGNISRKILIK